MNPVNPVKKQFLEKSTSKEMLDIVECITNCSRRLGYLKIFSYIIHK